MENRVSPVRQRAHGLAHCDVSIFAIDGNRSGFYDVVLIGKEDPWWKWVRAGKRYGIGESVLIPLRKEKEQAQAAPEEEATAAAPAEAAPVDIEPAAIAEAARIDEQEATSIAACAQAIEENVIESNGMQHGAILAAATEDHAATQPESARGAVALPSESFPEQSSAAGVMPHEDAESAEFAQVGPVAPSVSETDSMPGIPYPHQYRAVDNASARHADINRKMLDHSLGEAEPAEPDSLPRKVRGRNPPHTVLDVPADGSDEWTRLQHLLRSGGHTGQATVPTAL